MKKPDGSITIRWKKGIARTTQTYCRRRLGLFTRVDYKRMREIADKVGAILMIDMAHPAGLIAAGLLDNPVKYAHIVTSTTHKTFVDLVEVVIMMGKGFSKSVGKNNSERRTENDVGTAGFCRISRHSGRTAGTCHCGQSSFFGECLQPEFKEYQTQVQKNAKALANALIKRGFKIILAERTIIPCW